MMPRQPFFEEAHLGFSEVVVNGNDLGRSGGGIARLVHRIINT
jgi:hypothetical protein